MADDEAVVGDAVIVDAREAEEAVEVEIGLHGELIEAEGAYLAREEGGEALAAEEEDAPLAGEEVEGGGLEVAAVAALL